MADSDVFILSGAEDLVPKFEKDINGAWGIKDGHFEVIIGQGASRILIGWLRPSGLRQHRQVRLAVAVACSFQVAIGSPGLNRPVPFIGLGEIEVVRMFFIVSIDDNIALVVIARTDHPAENVGWISRIEDATFRCLAVPSGDVVF